MPHRKHTTSTTEVHKTTVSPSVNRTRANLTIPTWIFNDAVELGAGRGYGMSELVSRLLEKFVDDEKKSRATREGSITPPRAAH